MCLERRLIDAWVLDLYVSMSVQNERTRVGIWFCVRLKQAPKPRGLALVRPLQMNTSPLVDTLGANSDFVWLSHALARIFLISHLVGTCPDSE